MKLRVLMNNDPHPSSTGGIQSEHLLRNIKLNIQSSDILGKIVAIIVPASYS
jgi:hypothetical protein